MADLAFSSPALSTLFLSTVLSFYLCLHRFSIFFVLLVLKQGVHLVFFLFHVSRTCEKMHHGS